jgi:hypothetical protein
MSRPCVAFLLCLSAVGFAQEAVTTGHYDAARSGANTRERTLTPGNVNPLTFGQVGRMPVSGCIVAQPLFVPHVDVPGTGTRNIVYVATTANLLYAFDADDFTLYFARSFGIPAPSSMYEPDEGYYDFPDCDGLDERGPVGIVGTPVIDTASGALFVVANEIHEDGAPHHLLYKLSIRTGEDLAAPVEIAGTFPVNGNEVIFDSYYQLQRAALLMANGRIFVAFASHDDETPYAGWIFAYDTDLKLLKAFNYSPRQSGAGIWQSGGGPAFDGKYVYVTTGNNAQGLVGEADFADSILQIDPVTLEVVAKTSFPNEANEWDYSSDIDLGSSRVIPLLGTPFAVAGSKFGDMFVMNRADMSLVSRFQAAERHSSGFDWTGIYNGFAAFGNVLYVWPGGGGAGWDDVFPTDVLKAYRVNPDGTADLIAYGQTDGVGVGYQGAGLAISSNGTDPATAIVWAATPTDNSRWLRPGHLHAYAADANGVFQHLWSDTDSPDAELHIWAKFSQPLIANGRVYLPTYSGAVLVFGLLNPAKEAPQRNTRPVPLGASGFPRSEAGFR